MDTLPAVLADAPPLPGDLQRGPHFPPTPSTATRLVRVSACIRHDGLGENVEGGRRTRGATRQRPLYAPSDGVLFAARVLGEISAGMAYPTTLALIAALWSGPGRYSRGLSASGAASPACIGCRCCPRLTASTMILAPRPMITMPAII